LDQLTCGVIRELRDCADEPLARGFFLIGDYRETTLRSLGEEAQNLAFYLDGEAHPEIRQREPDLRGFAQGVQQGRAQRWAVRLKVSPPGP
jgi:hypothetical protein